MNKLLDKKLIVLQPLWSQPAVTAATESGTTIHHRKPAKSSKKKSYDEALSSMGNSCGVFILTPDGATISILVLFTLVSPIIVQQISLNFRNFSNLDALLPTCMFMKF